jgi:hypothetical protein
VVYVPRGQLVTWAINYMAKIKILYKKKKKN